MGKNYLLIAAIGLVCAGVAYAYFTQRKAKTKTPEQDEDVLPTDSVVTAKEELAQEVDVMAEVKSDMAQAVVDRHQQVNAALEELEQPQEEFVQTENTKIADDLIDALDNLE